MGLLYDRTSINNKNMIKVYKGTQKGKRLDIVQTVYMNVPNGVWYFLGAALMVATVWVLFVLVHVTFNPL